MKHSSSSSDKLTPFSVFLVTASLLLAFFNPSVTTLQSAVQRGFTSVGLPPFFKDRSYVHITKQKLTSTYIQPPDSIEQPWTSSADDNNWLPHMSRTIRQFHSKHGEPEAVWTNMFNIVKNNITSAASKVASTPFKIAAHAFHSTSSWLGLWYTKPVFGPDPRPPEVRMHCAVGGNATFEASEPVPPIRNRLQRFWHRLPWSTYDRWSFRGFFDGGIPTRQSPYLYWPWFFMFYMFFFWPFYGIGYVVLSIPWLFVLKWGAFSGYLYGLYHCYSLCKQEWKQAQLELEHAEWIEKIRSGSNGDLIVEFLNKLPGAHQFQAGGKHFHTYQRTYNGIVSCLQRKLVENFLVYQAQLKAAGKPYEWEVAYHGTRENKVQSCLTHGLLVPGQMIPGTFQTVAHSTDVGYFGKGIYCSPNRSYSEAYGASTLFVCLVLRGKFKKVEYNLGQGLAKGFDSHVDPSANEYIFFDHRAVLPIYLIHQTGVLDRLKVTVPKWDDPEQEKNVQALMMNVVPPAPYVPYVPPKKAPKVSKMKPAPSKGTWTKVVHFDGTVTWEPPATYATSSSSSSSTIKQSSALSTLNSKPSYPLAALPAQPVADDDGFILVKASKKRISKFSCVVH